MELRHLRYFVAVAESENVTRAAAKLRVAQPAVSRQIRDLEDELGLALLERTAKSVRLTDAGRFFLTEARAVLERVEVAVAQVRAVAGGVRGELHVGYAPSLTVQILPRALRRFQAEFPGVRVSLHDLSTEEMLAGIRDGKLDVALRVPPPKDQEHGLHFIELARFPLCAAVPPGHALAARHRSVTIARAADEPLIAYSRADYPEYHTSLETMFARIGRTPRIAEEHDSVTSLIAAVEAGRGIALVPGSMTCLVGPRLKILPLTPAPPPIIVGAITRQGDDSLTSRRFIAAAGEAES
ncbi:MAG: Transcriptional regulator, LysR family [Chthoniobacter sp.]|jgi:DNA-binding transcriptional LysR family regulator|nr:Transcriptional regulator, LysR family [Chthoniobacter sp.]